MTERVSCILGKKPVILIAPHGADDTNTDIIAELAAKQLNCYAVINRGFERADKVDVDNDKANCNRVDHVKQPVVFDEFLKPICKYTSKLAMRPANNPAYGYWNYSPVHLFHIHGCGNAVHKDAGEQVEIVVGYGLGIKKDSLSCDEWRKNCFMGTYLKYATDGVFAGSGGGKFGGRDTNNMNQYFRKHELCDWVQSMQLEFPFSARETYSQAATTAMALATVIDEYLQCEEYDGSPLVSSI